MHLLSCDRFTPQLATAWMIALFGALSSFIVAAFAEFGNAVYYSASYAICLLLMSVGVYSIVLAARSYENDFFSSNQHRQIHCDIVREFHDNVKRVLAGNQTAEFTLFHERLVCVSIRLRRDGLYQLVASTTYPFDPTYYGNPMLSAIVENTYEWYKSDSMVTSDTSGRVSDVYERQIGFMPMSQLRPGRRRTGATLPAWSGYADASDLTSLIGLMDSHLSRSV